MQRFKRGGKIRVPILLMYSDKSIYGDKWKPEYQEGDGVLNVKDIAKYGKQLGPHVTAVEIQGGLHDLVLSAPAVRTRVYATIFHFLSTIKY